MKAKPLAILMLIGSWIAAAAMASILVIAASQVAAWAGGAVWAVDGIAAIYGAMLFSFAQQIVRVASRERATN
ncbi:hypothetical protein [Sulfobacillus harzensis]|uniref:Uncharacterized protein n=1 Tax=Sulfobacillus harzensis TaxID=2729629 RepID=A0A7Y0Q3K0_9FIRM|nr:hypothetical protein [Sulfobacillus harzensis]NMP24348.1 hypothetical protein [Sulfobacillus harzensis]